MSIASSPSFVTPLRYPGGKARLGAWLADLIRHNGLENGCYIEPYAGGAGAAVFLLANEHVDRIVINDADPVIYAFWWALVNESERLVELIESTLVTMDAWYEQQDVIEECDMADLTRLGFATFFLNRTNRSGIIKGGVIGGKNQDGKYKIDARFNKDDLVARIKRLAKLHDRIQVLNLDAMDLLAGGQVEFGVNSLTYLDPPYYKKGSQLYRNHYLPEDHAAISDRVKELQSPWLVTYDNCPEIKGLYSDVKGVDFSFYYSTHTERPKGNEALFYGNLQLNSMPWMKR